LLNGGNLVPRIEWRTYEAGYCSHPECTTRRGGPIAAARFPALTFFLHHPRWGNILFDTGYSEHFLHATKHLPERLYRTVTPVQLEDGGTLCSQLSCAGVSAEDISHIVLSHFHGDHIGGLLDFPGAAIICSRTAWEDLCSRNRLGSLRRGLLPKLLPNDFLERVSWIEDAPLHDLPPEFAEFGRGHDIFGDESVLAVSLPGHAAGHYGLLFEDKEKNSIFLIADAAWSSQAIREGVPPPSLVTGWLGDTWAYRDTLQRLHRLAINAPAIRLLPSHCNEWRQW
jgi:glyoxylase-like metal-dependent hydrolase (beta-lactamase superfamily II)